MMMMMIVITVISFIYYYTHSCLNLRQPPLSGSVLWTVHQTPIFTIMAIPRSPCSAPSTEGSLLLPKSGLPTAISKQVNFSKMSLPMEKKEVAFLYFFTELHFSLQAQMQTPPPRTSITWSEGLSCDSPSLSSTSPPQALGASAHGDTEP